MSKGDIRPYFECQNRIFNVKMRYSARIRMSKWDVKCQNSIFGQSSNVKIDFLGAWDGLRYFIVAHPEPSI